MAKRKYKIETRFNTDLWEIKEINELKGRKNSLWGCRVPYDAPEESGVFSCYFYFKLKKGARIYQVTDTESLDWVLQNGMPMDDYDAMEVKDPALGKQLIESDAMKVIEPLFETHQDWPKGSILVWNFDAIVDEYEDDEEMDFEDDASVDEQEFDDGTASDGAPYSSLAEEVHGIIDMLSRPIGDDVLDMMLPPGPADIAGQRTVYRHYGSSYLNRGRSYVQPTDGSVPRGLWGIEVDKLPLLKKSREEDPGALTEEVGGIVDRLCETAEGENQGAEKNYFDFCLKEDAKILLLNGAFQIIPFINESTAADCFKQAFACYDGMIMDAGAVARSSLSVFREWPKHSIVVWNLDAVVPVEEDAEEDVEKPQPEPVPEPGFVGQIGETIIIKAVAIYLATTWRTGRLYLIEDTDGNIFTVKTRRRLPVNIEPGSVTLCARVKGHAVYKGTKQTWIERVRVF